VLTDAHVDLLFKLTLSGGGRSTDGGGFRRSSRSAKGTRKQPRFEGTLELPASTDLTNCISQPQYSQSSCDGTPPRRAPSPSPSHTNQ
jgi:hypothetical protein